MVLVDADVSIAELDGRYGAEILRTNVNRDAATLEEWVRYPVTERKGKPETAQGNFGYKENSWSVLDDTTIFGVAGNPSWQATAYLEAVQFAASWTPRLLLWNRELLQALEDRTREEKRPRDIFSIFGSSNRRSAVRSPSRTLRNCAGSVPIAGTWSG